MSKEKISKSKEFTYADRLGRITGEGRFNNVNSIIVNSHRYFQKEKEEKNRSIILNQEKNKFNTNYDEKKFDKYRYYPINIATIQIRTMTVLKE